MTELTATPARVIITSAAIGAGWGALLFLGFSLPWPLGAGAGSAVAHFVTLAMLKPPSPEGKNGKPNRQFANEIGHVRVQLSEYDPGGKLIGATRPDFVVSKEKLIKLAQALASGKTLSHSLSGKGRPFSRAEYEAVRDEMIVRGLARWKNTEWHACGLELTRGGEFFAMSYSTRKATTPRKVNVPNFARI